MCLFETDINLIPPVDCSSVIMSDIMASLPVNGQGGFFNAGGPGANGLLTSSDQLFDWLGQTILPALFKDAVCGDGQCDADEEPSIGRFGWYEH
jgi:hypothetical protein